MTPEILAAYDALIADLQARLDAKDVVIMELKAEGDLRKVTNYQIGQMVKLGIHDSRPVIYMQAVLNAYKRVLHACKLGHGTVAPVMTVRVRPWVLRLPLGCLRGALCDASAWPVGRIELPTY